MVVYVCSKLRGNIEENQEKVKQYCRQVVDEGNLPIAPHIYFTQFMDDNNVEDRIKALEMNKTLITICDCLYVYGEKSSGMKYEIDFAASIGKPIYYKDEI